MNAPTPLNEERRLQTLYDYEVLDSVPEAEYDDLVKLAASICGTPMAAVSLVDRDRQWFKSIVGLNATETPREISFCAHAILEPQRLLVVEDATQDARFEDNSLVTDEPHVRFYAGTPLVSPEGHPLGTLCVLGTAPQRLTDAQREALQVLGRQVTAQLELRRAVRRLEQQSADLGRALHVAQSSVRAKGTFLANMSHEIRTPLNGVIGMAEILSASPLSERQRRYVDTIRRSGEGLLALLNDVLEISEGDSLNPNVHRSDVVLATLLDEVVAMMQPAAEAKRLWIDLQVDGQLRGAVKADPIRLRQVLTSLLDNAIKFTPKGWIQVRATVLSASEQGRRIRFEVQDSGIGIPTDRRTDIFEEFTQGAEGNARPYGGTGLGLAIAKRHVEAMGGKLIVESETDSGSVFSFDLDLQTSNEPSDPRPVRVLVVEDNEVNSLVISAMLEQNGCSVECVENGVQAVEIVRHERFDMIFMDLHMPEMDGVTATLQLRAMEGPEDHVPIVAVTASAFTDEETRCRQAGMDGLIRKPINEKTIIDALKRFARVA